MAGRMTGFDADAFRDGIRLAFDMGAAPELDQPDQSQVAFHFASQLVYTGPTDGDGVPFDPNSSVTRVVPNAVQVPCGLEYSNVADERTAFGTVLPSRVKVTLLDEDYAKVKDATYIVVGGEKYVYHHSEMPRGLFDVGLYSITFVSESDL